MAVPVPCPTSDCAAPCHLWVAGWGRTHAPQHHLPPSPDTSSGAGGHCAPPRPTLAQGCEQRGLPGCPRPQVTPQPRHRAPPGSPEACSALKVKPEPSASPIVILPPPPPAAVLSPGGCQGAGPLPAVTPPAQPGDGSGRTRTLSRLSGPGRARRERRQHPEVCRLHPAAPRCVTPGWGPRAPCLPPALGHFQGVLGG